MLGDAAEQELFCHVGAVFAEDDQIGTQFFFLFQHTQRGVAMDDRGSPGGARQTGIRGKLVQSGDRVFSRLDAVAEDHVFFDESEAQLAFVGQFEGVHECQLGLGGNGAGQAHGAGRPGREINRHEYVPVMFARRLLDGQNRPTHLAQQALGRGAEQPLTHVVGAARAQHQQAGIEAVGLGGDGFEHRAFVKMQPGRDTQRLADVGRQLTERVACHLANPFGQCSILINKDLLQFVERALFEHMQQFEARAGFTRQHGSALGGVARRRRQVGGGKHGVQAGHWVAS